MGFLTTMRWVKPFSIENRYKLLHDSLNRWTWVSLIEHWTLNGFNLNHSEMMNHRVTCNWRHSSAFSIENDVNSSKTNRPGREIKRIVWWLFMMHILINFFQIEKKFHESNENLHVVSFYFKIFITKFPINSSPNLYISVCELWHSQKALKLQLMELIQIACGKFYDILGIIFHLLLMELDHDKCIFLVIRSIMLWKSGQVS